MTRPYVSQREIAEAAGVSVSAVSLALRNHPKVSKKKRLFIQEVARRMGYHADPKISELMEHLRTARPKRQGSQLAMLIPHLSPKELPSSFIGMIADGAREQAQEAGFGLDLFFPHTSDLSPRRIRTILHTRNIQGILVAPYPGGPGELDFDFSGFSAATSGYSLVKPLLHRSCPNYLQMLDEILDAVVRRGYRRIGLALHYTEGGIGHKLFSSAYLFYQAHIPARNRIPILPKKQIEKVALQSWISKYKPDAIIGPSPLFTMLGELGHEVPEDIGFASLDIFDPPKDLAGADHRYRLVGRETVKLLLSQINLNLTGLPEDPKVVLVDSHFRSGFSLKQPRA